MTPDREAVTVTGLLAARLREPRVHHLEVVAVRVAARGQTAVLAEIRAVLASPVTGEDCRRLHVLVSTLHRWAGVSLRTTQELQAQIETARAITREEVS